MIRAMALYYKAWLFTIWAAALLVTSPDWTRGVENTLGVNGPIVGAAVLMVHAFVFLFVLVCPTCGVSPFRSDGAFFLPIHHPWPNRRCSRCRRDHSATGE